MTPKQEKHGVIQYEILRAIREFMIAKKYATTPRIADGIKYKVPTTLQLLTHRYWGKYVARKPIKTPSNPNVKVDGCVFHWELTKKGRDRIKYLQTDPYIIQKVRERREKVGLDVNDIM